MKRGLAFWREPATCCVRVKIAEEQSSLKKDETSDPNGRRASEPGENQSGEERFDQEEKERSQENRCSEQYLMYRCKPIVPQVSNCFTFKRVCISGDCRHDSRFSG